MSEYIIPTQYQNMGCGISVKVAGLEGKEYKDIELSIDGSYYITIPLNTLDIDVTEIVSFDNLIDGTIYKLTARLTYIDKSIKIIEATMMPMIQTATVILSPEMMIEKYRVGGGITSKSGALTVRGG